jgi:preprotein translocase subunit SecY
MVANIISGGSFASLAFGGSSLLIVIGVAIEVFTDIEAQITMRNYKGFLD